MKRHIAFLHTVCMICIISLVITSGGALFPVSVYAAKSGSTKTKKDDKDKDKAEEKDEKDMTPEELAQKRLKEEIDKRKNIPIETNSISGWPKGGKTACESGVLLDLDSGCFLYSKNADQQLYPASITKTLTALVALDNCKLDEKVKITAESLSVLGNGYASIGCRKGDTFSMNDALHAMMLASANEVAYAICQHFGGGDYKKGVAMMNAKAKELGCTHSNFVNPNGIFNKKHMTTTHDMALIAAAAFKYEEFRKIVSTRSYVIKDGAHVPKDKKKEAEKKKDTESSGDTKKDEKEKEYTDLWLTNHHKMLKPDSEFYYEYCVGGKTGYTTEALNTLITFGQKGDRHLVCVTMKTRGKDVYTNTKKLLEYGFNKFQIKKIADIQPEDAKSLLTPNACVTIPKGASFDTLQVESFEPKNDEMTLNYMFNGYLAGTAKVKDEKGIELQFSNNFKNAAETKEAAKDVVDKAMNLVMENPLVIGSIGCCLILIIAGFITLNVKRHKKKHKRRRKRRRR